MTRVPPMASPAPPPPDGDRPRIVAKYRGMNVLDDRQSVLIQIDGDLPPGAGAGLRVEGFRRRSSNTWEAPANPQNYMAAQVIGSTFFSGETL